MSIAERQKPAPGEITLDHASHFVPDIEAASSLLGALGFVLTPLSAQHTQEGPAGSSNRCVMLERGYIELLTPTLDTPTAHRMRALMDRYPGVHLACFGTPDAQAEHDRLCDHGFEPQPLVDLSRAGADGKTARFRVVRPRPDSMPEGRIQYVEHLTPQHLWLPEYLAHDNGVTGLAAVYVVAADPVAVAARWARFAGLLPAPSGKLIALDTARGRILVGSSEDLSRLLGEVPLPPAIAGYALSCRRPSEFAARCAREGLAVKRLGGHDAVALPSALGGTWVLTRDSRGASPT